MSSSNKIDNTCKKCYGFRFIRKASIVLDEVCPDCCGDGYNDWVTKAMGRNSKSSKKYTQKRFNTLQKNTQILVSELKRLYLDENLNIDIELKIKPLEDSVFKTIREL
jgi:DnaJ-class molecular chaperone